ncbi:hypothetical protein ABZ896_11635 [Streptomyces sp. NPDC047072]|uniref:hypothetical protein n=1 Tax=Streptomyces sp. NPDC047072 TaxID=3154809 RepID=UPI0033D7C603
MDGEHGRTRRPRWREEHPEAYAELRRTYGVIGHSGVLTALSLSLIGTALTIGDLHLPEWLERAARLVASLGAVGCAVIALGQLLRALWRTARAVMGSRRRPRAGQAPPAGETAGAASPGAAAKS